jgi:hypothetical protein
MTASEVVISDHARFEMERRQIAEEAVRQVALVPEQVVPSGKGRTICQSRIVDHSSGKTMLLRVVTEERQGQLFVVTAYRTSKVSKYWQPEGEP